MWTYPAHVDTANGTIGIRFDRDLVLSAISLAGQWSTPGEYEPVSLIAMRRDGVAMDVPERGVDGRLASAIEVSAGITIELDVRCGGGARGVSALFLGSTPPPKVAFPSANGTG